MKSSIKYLLTFLLLQNIFVGQNAAVIKEYSDQFYNPSTSEREKLRLSLTLASEYSGYEKDSALYYVGAAKSLLKKYPNKNELADAEYLEALIYYSASEFTSSQLAVNQCIILSKEINNKVLLSKAYNLSGAIYYNLGNYEEAIHQYDNKLFIVAELKDTASIIETFYNFSLINNAEGAYFQSLENNYTALKLAEKTKDSLSILIAYGGLGLSYYKITDYKKAILYLKKALQLSVIMKRAYEQSGNMVDLGNVYREMNQLENAIYYYGRAQKIASRNGDRLIETIAISERGSALVLQGDCDKAIDLFNESARISADIRYSKGLAENYRKIAECNVKVEEFKIAKSYALMAIKVLEKTHDKKEQSLSFKALSICLEKLGDLDSAYLCYKVHSAISDSLENKFTLRKITDYESRYQRDRLEQERLLMEKKNHSELLKQKQLRNATLGATTLVLIMLLLSYRNYKLKEKANTQSLEQKRIIEHKNKDILDSVNYSRRLQDAMQASPEELKKILPESFIFNQPKDIISGNFYFVEQSPQNNLLHVALVDSANQGIPGAFMSIIEYSILKQALKESTLTEPGRILSYLQRKLGQFLRNQKTQNTERGLRISYCCIDLSRLSVDYSGAGKSAWIMTREEKSEIGFKLLHRSLSSFLYEVEAKDGSMDLSGSLPVYSTLSFRLNKGDILYLFTDGITLQNDEAGKLLGKERFAEWLNAIPDLSGDDQQENIQKKFNQWKGELPQNDDVCLIGIRF